MAASERVPAGQVLRIKSLRRWFGLSQGDFARVLGTPRSIIARWETSGGGPGSHTAAGRRALVLREIKSLAIKIFGHQAKVWFHEHVPAFNGATALETLNKRGPSRILTVLRAEWENAYL